jgi:hypothetical protein
MSWLTSIFARGEQERGDELDRRLREENARDAARYGPAWEAEVERNLTREEAAYGTDVDYELGEAFDEGLEEGAQNVSNAIRKPLEIAGTAVGAVVGGIPAWVWLVILAYGAWHFGLFKKAFK